MDKIRVILFFSLLAILSGCKKDKQSLPAYTISGQLLESSSNPVPVTGYRLASSQKSINSIGGLDYYSHSAITNTEGRFNIAYTPEANTLFNSGSINWNDIEIYGSSFEATWRSVRANIDTNLNTIYLYKKIDRLVRKVQFNIPLNSGEVLHIKNYDWHMEENYKTLAGPVLSGTLITLDTITGFKVSKFNLATQGYFISGALYTSSNSAFPSFDLPAGDESLREIVLVYE